MNKWELIQQTPIPRDGGELRLLRRTDEYAIRITGTQGDLMNSRTHSSEDALGELACQHCRNKPASHVLIGGLGMGFTLAAALAALPDDARVEVAELVPAIVDWNREIFGHCAGNPLSDDRVEVHVEDVALLIERGRKTYDAILLDVDNGPEGLTHKANDGLYSLAGLEMAYAALKPSGVLAVWSAAPAPAFTRLLRKAGFTVAERQVRAHRGKGARHMIWLASRE